MHTRYSILKQLVTTTAIASAVTLASCSKKSEPAAAAPAAQETPTAAAPATPQPPAAAAPAPSTPKADPLKSMVDSAKQAAGTTATQPTEPAAPMASAAPSIPVPDTGAGAPATPTSMPGSLSALQDETKGTTEGTAASLAASAGAVQEQAEALLTRYSGELATLKTGALALKNYVDQHPEMLPEAAKTKYQQLNSMIPQLDSLVGTLKDYRSADLTTLVPKLQNDFSKAKSLYSEVRALLPANI